MMSEGAKLKYEQAHVPKRKAEFQEAPGEIEADAAREAFLKTARTNPAGQAAALASADGPTRAHALHHLQRQRGNRYVQRVVLQRRTGPAVQRHASFEHRLLGDAPPSDLDNVARRINPQNRYHVLEEERQRLRLWQSAPESVTEAQVRTTWPGVRALTLRNGLVLTYGEMNTLGDYMANPAAIEGASRAVLLPILQLVRQQGFDRITDLLNREIVARRTVDIVDLPGGGSRPIYSEPLLNYEHFQGAVGPEGSTGTMASIQEVNALNAVTNGLDTNRYQALVSRNACHFAPFSWHRWREHHEVARSLAQRGHASHNAELVRQAWVNNGYADHFLQDSFAAGHLINKTLIMQWFVEWVTQTNATNAWYQRNIHLVDWDQVRTMTTANQPGLAGRHLYHETSRQAGESADPQTAEEQSTQAGRMATAGVVAGGGLSQEQAYQNYLAFLNNAVVQQASGAVHDYFNERSLWVSSPAHPDAFQVWGDETMVRSGEGVRIAAETARMSQQAIEELSTNGSTGVAVQQIFDRFPNKVRAEGGNQMLPLEQWNDSLRTLCFNTIFPDVHYRLLSTMRTHMGHVSQDVGRTPAPQAAP